jgi:hypothetical protein
LRIHLCRPAVVRQHQGYASEQRVGCGDDPYLTLAEFDNTLHTRKEGPGTLLLGSSAHGPVADIKVVQLRKATYIEDDLIWQCRTIARMRAKEFVPYLYGRLDDWTALDTDKLPDAPRSNFRREAHARRQGSGPIADRGGLGARWG